MTRQLVYAPCSLFHGAGNSGCRETETFCGGLWQSRRVQRWSRAATNSRLMLRSWPANLHWSPADTGWIRSVTYSIWPGWKPRIMRRICASALVRAYGGPIPNPRWLAVRPGSRALYPEAIEQGGGRMAIGQHAKLHLLRTDRVSQIEIDVRGEIVDFVAELGEPLL